MKVKVKIEFRDKYTGNLHMAGEELEISEERCKEIKSVKEGLVEPILEEKELEETEEPDSPDESESNEYHFERGELKKLRVDELKELAEKAGVSQEGKKEDIIERLLEKEEKDEES